MPVYFLEIIVVALGLLVLLIDAFADIKDKRSIGYIGILGLIVVFGLLFTVKWTNPDSVFWKFYAFEDPSSLFYKGIAVVTTLIVLIMAIDFAPVVVQQTAAPEEGAHPQAGLGEFFALPLFACAGLMWMASANNLVSIFVSLETVTIAFYVMVAYLRRNVGSLEAGVKYLILGALSTGFLVYGMAWLYGMTGSMELPVIREQLASGEANRIGSLFAFGLIVMAMGFKVGAVPFHNWIPDVYQGAPTPITAFLSVGSKAAGFVVFMRITALYLASPIYSDKVTLALTVIAILTLIVGNLVALPQSNFKRLLAYSSIAHAGFLLMAMACAPETPIQGQESLSVFTVVSFYLGAYLLMTLLAFLVMTTVRTRVSGESLDSYNGLAKKSPFLAVAMLVSMASLAGIPLTAGFFGKLFVFKLAYDQQQWILLAAGLIGACAGFYYYLKIAASMFLSPEASTTTGAIRISPAAAIAMVLLMVAIVAVGLFPALMLNLLQ